MKFKIIANEQTPAVKDSKFVLRLLDEDKKMLIKFLSFARRQYNCCGLAANQVSCDGERIMEKFFAIKVGHVWDLVLCPLIKQYNGKKEIKEEGCLTWLGKTIRAERFPRIKVWYYNLRGELIEREIEGFEAQIWQHEYNHLLGIKEEII